MCQCKTHGGVQREQGGERQISWEPEAATKRNSEGNAVISVEANEIIWFRWSSLLVMELE